MKFKKIISILILLVFVSSVSALTEQEKMNLLSSLDQFSEDPVRTRLVLSLLNNNVDISDDPELVKAVEDAATVHNINLDEEYPNIKTGLPPELAERAEQLRTAQEERELAKEQAVEQTEPTETTSVEPQPTQTEDIVAPIIIVAALAIGIIVYWFVKNKKKTK